MLDKTLLTQFIKRAELTQEAFASELGINNSTLFRKMTGGSDFTRAEIQIAKKVLKLSLEEADAIFFAKTLA